jgi:hypothetical protein
MSDGVTSTSRSTSRAGRTGAAPDARGDEAATAPCGGRARSAVSRLMALAIRFDNLVRRGEVADFAEIAELGQVTRARVSQIVNLLNLDPTMQEAILFLPLVAGERETVSEREVRAIASEPDWGRQREMWQDAIGSIHPRA